MRACAGCDDTFDTFDTFDTKFQKYCIKNKYVFIAFSQFLFTLVS